MPQRKFDLEEQRNRDGTKVQSKDLILKNYLFQEDNPKYAVDADQMEGLANSTHHLAPT